MLQKRKWKLATATDPSHATAKSCYRLIQVLRAAIGKFLSLDIAPQHLHRVEVRRITGKPFHAQPTALRGQVGLHDPAPVCGQAVPYQNDLLAAQSLAEILQEGHQVFRVVAAGMRPKEQTRALTIPAVADGRAHGDLGLVEGVDEDRRLAFGGPGSSHGGVL